MPSAARRSSDRVADAANAEDVMGRTESWHPGDSRAGDTAGLVSACAALGIPCGMLVLAALHPAVMWRRHSDGIPWACLAGGVLPAIVSIVLSARALTRRRSWIAWLGLALGLSALPSCLAIAWWLGMMVLAAHPA